MQVEVVEWVSFAEAERRGLPDCAQTAAYRDAIARVVTTEGLRSPGDIHQRSRTPVFSDGTVWSDTFRGWGALMAEIWSKADGKEYHYMDSYMEWWMSKPGIDK